MMLNNPFKMTNILYAVRLLDLLWEDDALDAYGPYGLGKIMKKYGVTYFSA